MVVPAQQQKCHQDGGSVTKSCPTLLTPWTVARQAPLSMGFSRQEYYSGLPDPGIVPRSPEFMADSSPSHQGSPNLVTKTDFFELASCVSPPMSCWSLSSEHTGSGRPDRLRKEGGAGKRQSRALRRWGAFGSLLPQWLLWWLPAPRASFQGTGVRYGMWRWPERQGGAWHFSGYSCLPTAPLPG